VNRVVIRAIKALGWCVAIALLVPMVGFLYYDLTRFQPHTDQISRIIAEAHPSERSSPPLLRKLVSEPRGELSLDASRLLVFKLKPGATRGNLHWKSTSLLWWLLVKVHLSEDEQLAIVCSASFLGQRVYGFEAGANTFFHRPLNRLTDSELATLAVRARNPSRWQRADRQEELAKAADRLLARVRGMRQAAPGDAQ